ncbi:hypothetical protein A9Q84_09140 [Halobacteriovorax marinus]|uniref:Uncharacterized protein n=1 Tax=Halobacteriovorax marinus TaxID=97084 RepID=A0A1Y5F6H7_9BACT|nr:hypothetical protein A9Q84_09140 [Halobacteriovorax marinus]
MVEKFKLIILILSISIGLASCKKAEESVEVTDQRRFETPPGSTTPTPPTNADISYTNSVVYMTKVQVFETQTSIISFAARDINGVAIEEGGLNITVSLLGDGTSSGTFGAINDHGNGVYDVLLTATTFGSPNTVEVRVDGNLIFQLYPFQYQVRSGEYYRDLTFSSATDQDEFQIKLTFNSSNIDYSKIDANGDDIRFFDSSFVEQDYWIEKWDTLGDSIVWVKVQNTAETSIIMSYGNATMVSDSNKEEVFSYDVAKAVYYELSQSALGTSSNISSYINNNDVTVNTTGGFVTATISPVVPDTFANVQVGPITVLGPISGRYLSNSLGVDSIAPLSFASKTLSYPKSRASDVWDLYNPNTTTATLNLYNYDSNGALWNSFGYTIGAGQTLRINYDVLKMGIIESDIPIIGLYHGGGVSDATLLMPPSADTIGAIAATATIGILEDSTTGTVYFSDGTSQGFSGNKGDTIDFSNGGSQKLSIGARIISNHNITAYGQADSDGSDSESFWPVTEMDDEYIIPTDSQYITVVCTETVSLIVTDTGGNSTTGTCVPPGGSNPGHISFGDNSSNHFSPGTKISGDAQFYVYYEYENDDETNVTSWKQARSYSPTEITVTVGTEQTW